MVLLLVEACGVKSGAQPSNPSPTPVQITLRAPKQGPNPCAEVTQATLTVSAADINPSIVVGPLPAASGQIVELKAMVPPGVKRLFTVTVSNDQNVVLCKASQEADLVAGVLLVLDMEVKLNTNTSLTSSIPLSSVEQLVTLTARVDVSVSGSGTEIPAGTVAFQDNGIDLIGCEAVQITLVDGVTSATCTLRLSGGAHSITAVYSGDDRFAGSTSPPLTPRVNPKKITLISIASNGTEGDGNSYIPAISATGRFVAFPSSASNLISGDAHGVSDIFVRDTCFGKSDCAATTTRISVALDGTEGDSHSAFPAISATGRFVVFHSSASNLAPGDTNGVDDIFLRDTCVGALDCAAATTRISVASNGTGGNSYSVFPAISATGRFVAFQSPASNLVPEDTNGVDDIFLRDTCLDVLIFCVPATTRISVASNGTEGNRLSTFPVISAKGRFVAFQSLADNLVPGDTNGVDDIFMRDTCLGASNCTPTTTLISVSSDGFAGNSHSASPAVSATGRFVAFQSSARNLVSGDTNGASDIFLRDTCFGASGCTPTTTRISVASEGTEGNRFSAFPAISADGRFIAFYSFASNLVSGDTNRVSDIFIRDTCLGIPNCTALTIRISVALDGTEGNRFSAFPAISADGRVVVFPSFASNLVSGDTNKRFDLFAAQNPLAP